MVFELLSPNVHDRSGFQCSKQPTLVSYFKSVASQDVKADLTRCFVAYDSGLKSPVIGYYTLSSYSLSRMDIPISANVKYQPYLNAPITLLGRLAVDDRHQGRGIGKVLLADSLIRSYKASQEIGSLGVMVEAIDNFAKTFYMKFGFIEILSTNRLFITHKTISPLIPK